MKNFSNYSLGNYIDLKSPNRGFPSYGFPGPSCGCEPCQEPCGCNPPFFPPSCPFPSPPPPFVNNCCDNDLTMFMIGLIIGSRFN